jgi:hypothetical protein
MQCIFISLPLQDYFSLYTTILRMPIVELLTISHKRDRIESHNKTAMVFV